jgi:predicted amidohydrolase
MTIAIAQTSPRFLAMEQNLENAVELIESTKADLFLFPELFLSGYTFSTRDQVETCALGQSDVFFDSLKKISEKRKIGICGGYAEAGEKGVYNSSFFIGDGELLGTYRKTHLFYREHEFFEPGDSGFFVVDYKGARLGMMICFDWIYPESARTLALLGADVVLHPANLVLPYCQRAMFARAVENRIFVATANRVGREKNSKGDDLVFTGGSQVVSPSGEYVLTFDETETGIRTVGIDPRDASRKELNEFDTILGGRRPQFYHISGKQ